MTKVAEHVENGEKSVYAWRNKKKQEIAEISLPKLEIEEAVFNLVGESPLIMHKWSAKAKKMILDKQTQKATKGRAKKDPKQDYKDTIYYDEDGDYAFPSIAFKCAAVRAGVQLDMKMTHLKTVFHVVGEFVKIKGKPNMREDMVRVGMGVADIRHRAEFKNWKASVTVAFNKNTISAEQIANLFQVAGFGVGIGEWRPEKNGSYGRFRIV